MIEVRRLGRRSAPRSTASTSRRSTTRASPRSIGRGSTATSSWCAARSSRSRISCATAAASGSWTRTRRRARATRIIPRSRSSASTSSGRTASSTWRSTGAAPRDFTPTAPTTRCRSRRRSSTRSPCRARGGDTHFASMYAAYDALPPRLKERLEGRHGRLHLWRPPEGDGAAQSGGPRQDAGLPPDHPRASGDRAQGALLRPRQDPAHRRPGREESDALIEELTGYMIQPDAPVPPQVAQGRHRHLGQPLLVPQGRGRLSARGRPHPLARIDQGTRRLPLFRARRRLEGQAVATLSCRPRREIEHADRRRPGPHLGQQQTDHPGHRPVPTFSKDDMLKGMGGAGVDGVVIHPPAGTGRQRAGHRGCPPASRTAGHPGPFRLDPRKPAS